MSTDMISDEAAEYLKNWLVNRRQSVDGADHYRTNVVIDPSKSLGYLGLPELRLERRHLLKSTNSLAKTDLYSLTKWMMRFLNLLRNKRTYLEAIELMRGEYDQKVAEFHVQRAINLVYNALHFDVGVDINITSTDYVVIEDKITPVDELLRQIFLRLVSQSSILLAVKTTHYCNCILAAYLVDLMHQSGAPQGQIELVAYDSVVDQLSASNRMSSNGTNKKAHGCVSVCLGKVDTFKVSKSIFESYMYQAAERRNFFILVEESLYEEFSSNWSAAYEHQINGISSSRRRSSNQLDEIGNLESSGASANDQNNNIDANDTGARVDKDIQCDMNCLDVKSAQKLNGHYISVIKFRSIDELCKLMNRLRKVKYVQFWSDEYNLTRELCLSRFHQTSEFLLNHWSQNQAGPLFDEELLTHYRKSMKLHMDDVYNEVAHEFEGQIQELKKLQANFVAKERAELRVQQTLVAYLTLINKLRSMKQMTASISESVYKMKKFHSAFVTNAIRIFPGDSRIERQTLPIGLAILVINDNECIKSKFVVIEFIFKNLLIGNGVLLVCPWNLLGVKFPNQLMDKYKLPFRMVHHNKSEEMPMTESSYLGADNLHSTPIVGSVCPELSSTTWETSSNFDAFPNSIAAKHLVVKCPKDTYAVRFAKEELTSARVECLVLALGSRRKHLWMSDCGSRLAQCISETPATSTTSDQADDLGCY